MLRWACSITMVLVACGPARSTEPTTPERVAEAPPPDCAALRAQADAAREALEACRGSAPVVAWPHAESFTWLDAHVGAHLVAAREGSGPSATIAEVQEIADRVWTLLDEVREETGDRALLDRTEDATEALMREHDADGRERALAGLAGALGALRADLEPAPPPSCESEERQSASAWMSAQAQCTGVEGETR